MTGPAGTYSRAEFTVPSRKIPISGAAVVAAAALVILSAPAGAQGSRVAPVGHAPQSAVQRSVQPSNSDCIQFDQSANQDGLAIISQNFESGFDQYDSQAADDFAVTKNCKGQAKATAKSIMVSNVTAFGIYFNGSGPVDSFNVTFYANRHSAPGRVVKQCDSQPYTSNAQGGFQIDLAKIDNPKATCVKKDLKLQPKTVYWVSVQANMDFSAGGEWGWNTVTSGTGTPAMWENPGDGFGSGCTTYTTLTACIANGEGGNLAFQILR